MPRQPDRRQNPGEQQYAPADFEGALRLDDAADVVGVALAETGHYAFFDGVEFTAERLGLLGCQGDMGL